MARRAPNLTEARIDQIVEIVRGIDGRRTWPALIAAVHKAVGATYTRQGLFKHEKIRIAMGVERASSQRGAQKTPRPKSKELKATLDRLERAEHENAELTILLERMRAKFVRWAYNASLRGITEAQLDEPLPPIDRNRNRL
ncbi:hypothetical protein [Microvirga tunisiensis]|uniref:Uncharacterized protein n=1 Tax=Microvirga tunisiensis TaxID=2108360 RepID=A0A5N7MPA2_9HYPH|nr:hypothetical protein [Microvirga tunisiensis]MPR10988.1 hypothetical protein [Microvirga tunisiensis]MPR28279.1 hypothetical protein [Microvirga tunisiensis]